MKQSLLILFSAILAFGVLAGCGGDEDADDAPAPEEIGMGVSGDDGVDAGGGGGQSDEAPEPQELN